MNKKKIGLIVVVLFLLLGLGSFVFANPSEKENLKKGEEIEEVKDKDSKEEESDEDLSTDVDALTVNNVTDKNNNTVSNITQNNGNNENGNNDPVVKDDSYEKALEAVKKAEESFTQGDVNDADKLVDKVKDESLKNDLLNRLNEVQNAIDAEKLVEKLENKVKDATDLEDMNDSRTYRTESEVVDLVSKLSDSKKKQELQDRLDNVDIILDDNNSPVIQGIDNNSFVRKDVKLTITDKNDYTVKVILDGKEIEFKDNFTKEGTYEVVATDKSFNETKVTFTIDKTAPVVKGAENGKYYNEDVTLEIIEENIQNAKISKDGGKMKEFKSGATFTEEGTYFVKVTDKAYNTKVELTFTIDKTNPAVVSMIQEYEAKEDGRIKVTINTSEEIFGSLINKNGWRKVSETEYYAYYYRTKDITIKFIDIAGNEGSYTFRVDADAPKLDKLQVWNKENASSKYVKNGETVRFIASFTEELEKMPIVTLGKQKIEFTKSDDGKGNTLYVADVKIGKKEAELAEGLLTFSINGYKDKTGNEGIELTEVNLKNNLTYDRTAPEFVIKNDTIGKDGIYSRISFQLKDNFAVVSGSVNGKEFTRTPNKYNDLNFENAGYVEGENVVIVRDAAGNENSIKFVVDKTAPTATITKSNDDKSTNQDVVVTLVADEEVSISSDWTKVDETTYTKIYSENGKYSVEITDKAGNKSVIKFEVKRIDKVAPTAIITKSNDDKSTNQDVVVTLVADEAIYEPEGWTTVPTNKEHEFTRTYSENGKYSVEITDKAGNKSVIKFEVKRIDKVAPTAIITKSNDDKSTNQDVVVTLVADEAIYEPEGWTTVPTNKEHEFTRTYSENGKYSVEITDKAGNKSVIKFEVKRIDKVAPKITVVDPNKYYIEAGDEYVEKGYSAWDAVDKDVTHLVKITYRFQATGKNWEDPDTLDTKKVGTYKITYTAYDKAGNSSKASRVVAIKDTTAPEINLNGEEIVNIKENDSYVDEGITVTDNAEGQIMQSAVVYYSKTGDDGTWTTVDKVNTSIPGHYNVYYSATDQSGNTSTARRTVIVTEIPKANLVASAVGSNLIDEAGNTINNFNSFAIKFDRDLTFRPISSNQKYMIDMEYSTDGVHYTKSNYTVDNWGGTLVDQNGNKYGSTFGSYTIKANSSIHWSGSKVGNRWTDIYNAIKETKDTDNKVYVRTIFTVVQPDYTKSYTLEPVVYSQGGYEVTPRGLPSLN